MSSAKEDVREMLRKLPDDCTYADIKYIIYLRAKIQEGLAALEQGQTLTQEEVDREVEEWLKSLGSDPH
jgi:hypothetical protein